MKNMEIPDIQIADSEEKLTKIYKFRYDTYIRELGDTYDGVDDSEGSLRDELDEFGIVMYAEEDGELIGTCRLNIGCHGPFDEYWDECYDLSAFPDHNTLCLASKMMIIPEQRGSFLGMSFLMKAIDICKENGAQFIFLDCIPPLVSLYEIAGFRRYKKNAPEDKNLKYYIPLVGCLEDLEYVKKIGSPFYDQMAKHPVDQSVSDWFNATFQPRIGFTMESLIPYEDLQQFVSARIDLSETAILKGLDNEEAKAFLQAGMVTYCQKGETITFQGDSGSEMYLLLEGEVEIRKRTKAEKIPLTTLAAGEIFGETNYLLKQHRLMDAAALSDITVLVINQSFRKQIRHSNPALAAKFAQNLAKIIATRSAVYLSMIHEKQYI